MDYNNFITKYRTNPDYKAEQEARQKQILAEQEAKQRKEEASKPHPQPFTILFIDDKDPTGVSFIDETFFAMDVKDAKKYVRQTYPKLEVFSVFYGESTADVNMAFNDESK